jgi:hypothetical protein
MTDWIAPPDSMTWTLQKPVEFAGATYPAITLRSPTVAETLKATAVRSATNLEATCRLIGIVSAEGIPYEAIILLPTWLIEQMSGYMDAFAGAPAPDPLEQWYQQRREAAASGN